MVSHALPLSDGFTCHAKGRGGKSEYCREEQLLCTPQGSKQATQSSEQIRHFGEGCPPGFSEPSEKISNVREERDTEFACFGTHLTRGDRLPPSRIT
jgi:hypothetical protein